MYTNDKELIHVEHFHCSMMEAANRVNKRGLATYMVTLKYVQPNLTIGAFKVRPGMPEHDKALLRMRDAEDSIT